MSEAVKHKNISLFEEYEKSLLSESPLAGSVSAERAKNDMPIFKFTAEGKQKYVHSRFDPAAEAEKFADSLEMDETSTVLLFGFGYSYFAAAILERCGEKNKLVCIEPSREIFYSCAENIDLRHILSDSRVTLSLCDNEELMKRKVSELAGKNITLALPPVYAELFGEESKLFANLVRNRLLNGEISKNTLVARAGEWAKNFYKNIPEMVKAPNIAVLKDIFSDRPAILVSAGPSLDKNIDKLRDIKGIIPIVCVYTAYRALLEHGIEPDIVVSLDALQTIHETEEERTKRYKTPLVFSQISEKALLDKFTGKKILLPDNRYGPYSFLIGCLEKELPFLELSLTVAYAALSIIIYAGSREIIFVGQDFALAKDRSHASGTFYDGKNIKPPEKQLQLVEAANGGEVVTTSSLYAFKLAFEERIFNERDIRFIDATEGGAKIKGTEIMKLSEACLPLLGLTPLGSRIADVLEGYDSTCKLEGTKKNLVKLRENFEQLKQNSSTAVGLCEKLLDIYSTGQEKTKSTAVSNALQKLDKLDEKIQTLRNEISILNTLLFNEFDTLDLLEQGENVSDELFIIYKNKMLYNALLDGAIRNITSIDSVLPALIY